MIRRVREFFGFAEPAPPVLIPVDGRHHAVLQIERGIQLARRSFTPVEVRLTRCAYERLCKELGVKDTSTVCGLPIRIVNGAHA
jgi:hypothetical protein